MNVFDDTFELVSVSLMMGIGDIKGYGSILVVSFVLIDALALDFLSSRSMVFFLIDKCLTVFEKLLRTLFE